MAVTRLFIFLIASVLVWLSEALPGSEKVWAAELGGQPKIGVEPLAMGRAYSAIADDWLALHYNPANLAAVRGLDLKLLHFKIGGNQQIYNSYNDINDLDQAGTLSDTLNVLAGKQLQFDIETGVQFTVPHFALGAYYEILGQFSMINLAYPTTTVTYTKDFSIIVGTGWGIGRHRKRYIVSIGSSLRIMQRQGGTQDISIDTIGGETDALLSRFSEKGRGIGVTPALTFQWPLQSRMEISNSVVWHNLGKISFGKAESLERPTRIEDNLTVGMGIRMPFWGKLNRRRTRRFGQSRGNYNLSFTFDYSHLNLKADEADPAKKMHAGMRLKLPFISLYLGNSQTQWTYGFSIDALLFDIKAASYTEELGSFAGQQRDRRYVLSITGGFSVDRLSFSRRPRSD